MKKHVLNSIVIAMLFAFGGLSNEVIAQTIEAGSAHSLSICNNGEVMAWGSNYYGQLGNGTNGAAFSSEVPVPVSIINGITSLSGCWGWSLALKNDGTVWTWGINSSGQLGNGTTTESNIPISVSSLSGITAIAGASSSSSAFALKNDGTVWAWGNNDWGKLGDGTNVNRSIPVQVSSLSGITTVATGGSHSFAIKNDGTVWGWGRNLEGQIGLGTFTNWYYTPVQVSVLTDVIAITLADNTSIALKNDGTVWAWGSNSNGELGNGTSSYSTVPVQINSLTGITNISGGNNFFLALKNDGTVHAWGRNNSGQLGIGTNVNSNIPVQVGSLTGINSISAGGEHAYAVKNDGTVWCWGSNGSGQFGNGTYTNSNTPVQVNNLCTDVGVAENFSPNLISVYPNPSNGLFNMSMPMGDYNLEVFSSVGQLVYSSTVQNSTNHQMDLSNAAKGVYTVRLRGAESTHSQRIILQ